MVTTVKKTRTRRQDRSPELLARIRDWIEREIRYVDHPVFSQTKPAERLMSLRPASLDVAEGPAKTEPGLAFVAGMVNAPLLTQAEESYLFQQMNFLKFRAEQARQKLCLNHPDPSLVDRIETDLRDSVEVRNRIVRSNLRLVVALARKFSLSLDQMSELIGEATVPLIRAVELFDISLGNRFSTYATWAVRNHMLRCINRRQAAPDHVEMRDQTWLDRVPDERCNPEEEVRLSAQRAESVKELLTSLSERERFVITARFGLDGQPRGQSLQDIADKVGLSKERVRQITLSAIEKLRGVALSAGSPIAF